MTKIDGRTRMGIALFATLALLPYAGVLRGMSYDLPERPPGQNHLAWLSSLSARDVPTRYEKRLASLKGALPPSGEVGFISDENPSISEYYMAQYALAPLVLRSDARAQWVICAFHNPKKKQAALRNGHLRQWFAIDFVHSQRFNGGWSPIANRPEVDGVLLVERDLGDGYVLLKRSQSRSEHKVP